MKEFIKVLPIANAFNMPGKSATKRFTLLGLLACIIAFILISLLLALPVRAAEQPLPEPGELMKRMTSENVPGWGDRNASK